MARSDVGAVQQSTGTEGRLNALQHEFSDMGRAADALMRSGVSGLGMSSISPFDQTTGDSDMYQTAMPFEATNGGGYGRRRSVSVSMHRNGEMDFHLGASKMDSSVGMDDAGNVTAPIDMADLSA